MWFAHELRMCCVVLCGVQMNCEEGVLCYLLFALLDLADSGPPSSRGDFPLELNPDPPPPGIVVEAVV